MKALIIGGAGFVGSYLMQHLHDEYPWQLYCTKLPAETVTFPDAQVFDLDILDKSAVRELLNQVKPDYIFHLAAQSSVALSWKNPELTIDVNIKGCVHILDALRECRMNPRVLMIGSGEEYGYIRPEEVPITESITPRPGNIYAATKACQNMLAYIYTKGYQMNIIMVRAFNHIGPGQAPAFVVSDFCKQVAEMECGQKPPTLYVGNLDAQRDFTDVRDVVTAYALLIQKGEPGQTYNVGSSKAVPIQTLLNAIVALAAVPISVEISPEKLRPADIPIIEASISKLQKCTGWVPRIPLSQTIEETLNYWRQITKNNL